MDRHNLENGLVDSTCLNINQQTLLELYCQRSSFRVHNIILRKSKLTLVILTVTNQQKGDFMYNYFPHSSPPLSSIFMK